MTLRMPKVVASHVEGIAKSALWAAASRIGVPLILALVMTGIPVHLLWAARVNEELALAKRDIAAVVADVRELKEARREDTKTEATIQSDIAAVKTSVSAILRAIDRVEKQMDSIAPRRQP